MCGIAGFVDESASDDKKQHVIQQMCDAVRHRGPDGEGFWKDESVALGVRRLAIIDLEQGQQPMANADGDICVAFNGEIYNYKELRTTLQQRGHRFLTLSDTEVIIHAYEEFGNACIKMLHGMFAFALWDKRRQGLLLARDRFGKKPLHYAHDGKRIFFASEIKSLLRAPVARDLNMIALDEFLTYDYVPAPNTLFRDIVKLPPAHFLWFEAGMVHIHRYWELSSQPTSQDDVETAREQTLALLNNAIAMRLNADVPIGALLSGGVDSSLVVALMSQMMDQPVKTFSIGFEETDYNELPFAREIAKRYHTEHREFIVKPEHLAELPKLIEAYDEPFADPSMLPTHFVSKLAREDVTVVLTGDGGDEVFGGYRRYACYCDEQDGLPERYANYESLFPLGARSSLYTSDFWECIKDHNPYNRIASKFRGLAKLDTMTQMQYVDIHSYLPDDVLVKVDRASMFNSLEARAPFLDHRLVEYVFSLPAAVRTPNFTPKTLLKQVASEWLPKETLSRPKQGFSVPLKHWFRGSGMEYIRQILDKQTICKRGIIDYHFMQNLLDAHQNNRGIDHSKGIWALLCLELWFQSYADDAR